MAIFGALVFLVPMIIAAGIVEGILYLRERAQERREWKYLKAAYYPDGKWRRTEV